MTVIDAPIIAHLPKSESESHPSYCSPFPLLEMNPSARGATTVRVRSTRVSFRQQLVDRVNEGYGAECQRLMEAWANYHRATMDAEWAAIDKEDNDIIIEYDEETGIPVNDTIVINPPDDCEFSSLPSAIGIEDDAVMEDILPTDDSQAMDVADFTEAQAALRAKIHQSFKHALDNLQAQWKEHLEYITQSRYLQTFYRPPAERRDIVARLRHLAKYDERLWHHEMRMPRYAFEDILERIQVCV